MKVVPAAKEQLVQGMFLSKIKTSQVGACVQVL